MSSIILLSGSGNQNGDLDNSYIIIGTTLYLAKDGYISQTWQLTGDTVKQLDKSARKQAHLHGSTRIYYDDDCVFDADKIAKTGQLSYIKHDSGKKGKDVFCGAAQRMVRGI